MRKVMKKRFKMLVSCLILISLVLGIGLTVSAENTVSGTHGSLKWTFNQSSGELIISGNGKMFGFYNSELTSAWNAYKSSIKIVKIEEGVTSVSDQAFSSCTALTSVQLPNSITKIDMMAFYGCTALSSIVLPNGLQTIGSYAFGSCSNLKEIEIPNSVTSIGMDAFSWCERLETVKLPTGITSIEERTFEQCQMLSAIEIPDGVVTIGTYAFSDCFSLKSIHFPKKLETIEEFAFSGYETNTLEKITITSGNAKFHVNGNCLIETQSKNLVLGCKNSVIPKDGSVTSIGDFAFNSSGITAIIIPKSVTSIGECAFAWCRKLTKILYLGSSSDWNRISKGISWNQDIGNDYVVYHETCAWNSGSVTQQPTHIQFGTKTFNCTVCGNTKAESIDKLSGHTFGSWIKHNGEQHQKKCECGAVEYEDHAWSHGEVISLPSQPEYGVVVYTCVVCGETKNESFGGEFVEHNWTNWVKHDEVEHKRGCACGEIQYANHVWDGGEVFSAPTHTQVGQKKFLCIICGEAKIEDFGEKLPDHVFGDWKEQNEERHKRTCACGEVEYVDHVYGSDHDIDCNDCGFERIIGESKKDETGCNSVTVSSSVMLLCVLGICYVTVKKKEF